MPDAILEWCISLNLCIDTNKKGTAHMDLKRKTAREFAKQFLDMNFDRRRSGPCSHIISKIERISQRNQVESKYNQYTLQILLPLVP